MIYRIIYKDIKIFYDYGLFLNLYIHTVSCETFADKYSL